MLRQIWLAVLVAIWGTASAAQGIEANIMTGGPAGTYIQFGNDLADLLAEQDFELTVVESEGSVENLWAVFRRPQTQFGIVQSDVLDFVRNFRETDSELQQVVSLSRIVAPLYNEEIHVVTTPDIAALEDLAGRRVGVSPLNSGTQLTSSIMLDALGIVPAETDFSPPQEALEKFLAGDLDAFFYVAGAPTSLLLDDRLTSENARLLPLEDPALSSYYPEVTFAANTYSFQPDPVPGNAVKAVLMTYHWEARQGWYFEQSCDVVRQVSAALYGNLDRLREEGHPKWQQVDVTDIPPGWDLGSCVVTEPASSGSVPSAPRDCSELTNPISRQICESAQN